MNDAELLKRMSEYSFYHVIKLTDTISTPGNPEHVPAQRLVMDALRRLELKDSRVLDLGCRDGLFSFAAESMGAREVVGIDNDLSKPAVEFLIPYFDSRVRMQQANLYELSPQRHGTFDVVIFAGVLYHLRYPFFGLKVIRDVMKPGGTLLIDTPIWEGDRNNAMLFCPVGDDSPYESTSCTFFNEKGLTDTLSSMGFTVKSVEYLRRTGWRGFLDRFKHTRTGLGSVLPWSQAPIKRVTRCLIEAEYVGHDPESFEARYWESTHDYHSREGG